MALREVFYVPCAVLTWNENSSCCFQGSSLWNRAFDTIVFICEKNMNIYDLFCRSKQQKTKLPE